MAFNPFSFQLPLREKVVEPSGLISRVWMEFFRLVKSYLDPLGVEKSFPLVNHQVVAANIEGLSFDKTKVSQGIVEFLIQRITTGGGGVELIATGVLHAVYKPISNTWAIVTPWTPGPSTSGITFSITSSGQVQYTSTNEGGTEYISRIVFRVRTLSAKHTSYSEVG